MSTGTKIILKSLRKIQVNTLNSPASPEDIEGAVTTLNSMLSLWKSKGIELGITPLESAGNELGEPLDATNAIISNLAIRLADDYEEGQAVVTPTLINNANRDYQDLINVGYRKFVVPQVIPSSTLLTGEGNRNRFGRRRNFFGPDRPLGK